MKTMVDPDEWIVINKLFFQYWIFVRWIPKLRRIYELARFVILEKFDPPPKMKKGESDSEWTARVDLKYSLRLIRAKYANLVYFDGLYQQGCEPGALDNYSKRVQKKYLKYAREVSLKTYLARQLFQELLDKKRIINGSG